MEPVVDQKPLMTVTLKCPACLSRGDGCSNCNHSGYVTTIDGGAYAAALGAFWKAYDERKRALVQESAEAFARQRGAT